MLKKLSELVFGESERVLLSRWRGIGMVGFDDAVCPVLISEGKQDSVVFVEKQDVSIFEEFNGDCVDTFFGDNDVDDTIEGVLGDMCYSSIQQVFSQGLSKHRWFLWCFKGLRGKCDECFVLDVEVLFLPGFCIVDSDEQFAGAELVDFVDVASAQLVHLVGDGRDVQSGKTTFHLIL